MEFKIRSTSKRFSLKKHNTLLLCFLLNFCLPLLFDHKSTKADIIANYNPPPGSPRRPQRTEGSGSRGCSKGEEVTLRLIVPSTHTATTTTSHPTLLWYVSSSLLPLRFTLVEPGVAQPVYEKQLNITSPGIVRLEVPKNSPGLATGKEYRWTVSVICNVKRPSENTNAYAWIKRIPKTPELKQNLEGKKKQQQAAVYAQRGIWYDTVACLLEALVAQPNNTKIHENLLLILRKNGLSEIALLEQKHADSDLFVRSKNF